MKICLALLSLVGIAGPVSASTYLVYFGTYTGPKSQGIYVSRFDTQTGKLENVRLAGEISQPSWVAIHPKGKVLYAVTETGYDGGEGSITSFAINPADGELKQINKVSSGGGAPCHLTVDKAGKTIFVANYASGS